MNRDEYEIRPIAQKSQWALNQCTGHSALCHEMATYYLVHKSIALNGRPSESRCRRCTACAKLDSKSLRIPFPEVTG